MFAFEKISLLPEGQYWELHMQNERHVEIQNLFVNGTSFGSGVLQINPFPIDEFLRALLLSNPCIQGN